MHHYSCFFYWDDTCKGRFIMTPSFTDQFGCQIFGWSEDFKFLLPCEILCKIMAFLHINDLISVMSVSTQWRHLSLQLLNKISILDIRSETLLRHQNVHGSLLEVLKGRERLHLNRLFIRLINLMPNIQAIHIRPGFASFDMTFILDTVAHSHWWDRLTEFSLTSQMKSISSTTFRHLASLTHLRRLTISGLILENAETALHETLQALPSLTHVSCFIRLNGLFGIQRYSTDFVKYLPLHQVESLSCPVDAITLMQTILDQPLTCMKFLSLKLLGVLNLNLTTLVCKLPVLSQLEIYFESSNHGKLHNLHVLNNLNLFKMQVYNARIRKGCLRRNVLCPNLSLNRVRLSKRLCHHLLKTYTCYSSNGKLIVQTTVLNAETKSGKVNLVDNFGDVPKNQFHFSSA